MSTKQKLKNLYKLWDKYTEEYGTNGDEFFAEMRDQLKAEQRSNG